MDNNKDHEKIAPGMLSHSSIKEIMVLRKLDHPNIASAQRVHYSQLIGDLSVSDPEYKKKFKMYIEMEKADHDLFELTNNRDRIKLSSA